MTTQATTLPAPTQTGLQALRGTAQAKSLGKALFSPGASSAMNDAQIASAIHGLIRLSGLPVPESVNISLDGAQMLLAGGVFVTDLNTGATLAQCASPLALTIGGLTSLMSDLGILDDQFADFASLAVNGILAISSGGVNILADIGAVIALIQCIGDAVKDLFGDHDAAVAQAKQALGQAVHAFIDPQIAYGAQQISLYNQGRLNVFDLIGNIALNAPYVFPNYFPGLACYFPSQIITISVTRTSDGLFGSSSDTESYSFKELVISRIAIQDVLIQQYLIQPMQGFEAQHGTNCISLRALSVLALILQLGGRSDFVIGYDFDVLTALRSLGITPGILGDTWLFQGLSDSRAQNGIDETPQFDPDSMLPYLPRTLPAAMVPPNQPEYAQITYNGEPAQPQMTAQVKYAQNLKAFQQDLIIADQGGFIDDLYANPEARAMMQDWAKIWVKPSWADDGSTQEPLNLLLKQGSTPISQQPWFVFDGPATHYTKQVDQYIRSNYVIDLSDYWKCLSTLNTMLKANLFADPSSQARLYAMGAVDNIDALYKSAHLFFLAKNINLIAQNNVAGYIGAPNGSSLQKAYDTLGNPTYTVKQGT
jgi:hypothetical protein